MLVSLRTAWERLWFSPVDPRSLALFRIAVGILYLAMFLCLAPNWQRYFSPDGILSLHSGGRALTDETCSLFHWLNDSTSIAMLGTLGVACSVSLIIGFRTRVSIVTLFILQSSMIHRNRFIVNGEDLVLRMLLFYACFAPLGYCFSIDALITRREGRVRGTPRVWPVRLMQINLALIYVISLPIKLQSDPAWLNGDFMYFALNNSTWSRWPWHRLTYSGNLSAIMTYTAILVEGTFPALVWFRKTRVYMVAIAMAFHLLIAIILKNVTFFSLAMVCGFIVFIPGEWSGRVLDRIRASGHASHALIPGSSRLRHQPPLRRVRERNPEVAKP